jgi:hypothetical protein
VVAECQRPRRRIGERLPGPRHDVTPGVRAAERLPPCKSRSASRGHQQLEPAPDQFSEGARDVPAREALSTGEAPNPSPRRPALTTASSTAWTKKAKRLCSGPGLDSSW